MSIESVMPSNHLVLCHPLLLLPSILPIIDVFSNESALSIRWPKYWSFSISPSNHHSGLISLRLIGLISLLSKGLSRVFSSISIGKHQFFGTQPSLCSSSHTVHDRWRKHSFDQSEWMREPTLGPLQGVTAGLSEHHQSPPSPAFQAALSKIHVQIPCLPAAWMPLTPRLVPKRRPGPSGLFLGTIISQNVEDLLAHRKYSG